MTLWFALALMTAAATLVVLWPLSRNRIAPSSDNAIAVYQDQIREIARDRGAGLIADAEAEAARIEVSRRLLKAADAADKATNETMAGSSRRQRFAAAAALVALPAGTLGLYLALGSPNLPGEPLAARLQAPPQNRSLASMLAEIETHLEREPNDARGWQVVSPIYLRLGRYAEAVKARRNVLALLGSSAERESDLGEALVAAGNGVVTVDAKASFDRAIALDPRDARSRFFLGLSAEQDGKPTQAATIWRSLLRDAPPAAPWTQFVREALMRVEGRDAPAAGPSSDDVAAAAELTADQREQMVRGMVARLADRLEHDGSDLDGWLRLVRAYTVLGEHDRVLDATASARRALAGDPEKLHQLDELLKSLGSTAESAQGGR